MDNELQNKVLRLCHLLRELKGENTVALRLKPSVSWARYCVLSTCNSLTHMRGLLRHLRSNLRSENPIFDGVQHLPRSLPEASPDNSFREIVWLSIDLGDVVAHLMNRSAREFYELEQLWPVAEIFRLPQQRYSK